MQTNLTTPRLYATATRPGTLIATVSAAPLVATVEQFDAWSESTTPANAITLDDGTTLVTLDDGTTILTTG